MADIASIIANIDGYRTYEQNRALDLQNQAAQMANNQNAQIWDLKRALAQNTPDLFQRWAYFDPQGARQKQLSDEQQLKEASTWANSIQKLAPENREQGYAQFLRAMKRKGIDVSDMPQAYDESYVNQMAELGIDPETRYSNEQTNARLERQIDAKREARQDEFNKKLAAFDYENNYSTKAATERQAQTDEYIKNLGLDADLTKKLLATSRGINLPDDVKISPINAMTDEYLDPLTTDERRVELLGDIKAYREREQALSELLPPEDKKYASGDLGLVQYMTDQGIALDDALVRVGKMTPEQKVELAGAKAAAEAEGKLPSSIRLEDVKYQNNVGLENIKQAGRTDLAYLNNRLAMERDANQNILNMKLEDYKKSLPTENLRQMQEQAQITGIPVDEIARQELQDKQLEAARKNADIELKQAQIAQTQASTNKTNAEIPYAGMTDAMKNDRYLMDNPERVNSPVFDKTKTDKGESELRKEFNALTKDYRTIGDSYSRILQAAERKSAAGDLSLIFNYMKMLDPNSVVRESEFSNAENARAWFDESGAPTAIKLAYNKAKNGQRLLDEQRKDFVNMADLLMRAQKQSFEALGNRYKEIAEDAGYNPDNVVIDPYANSINKSMENPVIEVGGSKEYNNGFKIERVD